MTCSLWRVSEVRTSRPALIGIPIAAKYPGVTTWKPARGSGLRIGGRVSFRDVAAREIVAADRQRHGGADGADAGHLRQPLLKSLVELRPASTERARSPVRLMSNVSRLRVSSPTSTRVS